VYPFLPFARCLKEKAPQPARVVSAGGVNINVAVAPVLRGDACIGAFATVQRFNDAENRQNELRSQLPVELKRAQELLAAREKFVDEAKRDVERMMRQADLEAKSKISDSEVLYAAKEKARKIIADAEDRSRQLCQVANEYAEDALARTEEAVQAALTEVKQSRSAFRAASAAKLQEQREKLDAEKKNAEQPES